MREGITKREKKRILHDNNAMALRITSQSATINRDKQLMDSQKYIDFGKRLEKIPRAQRIARTAITNPEYRYTFHGSKQKNIQNSEMNSTSSKLENSSKKGEIDVGMDASKSNGFFKTHANSNWFGKSSLAFEKTQRFDKNPNEYNLEIVVNKLVTFKNEVDKYRFVITHKSFNNPIVFNPVLNDPCSKSVLTLAKCKNDIE